MSKVDATNYNTQWVTPAAGGAVSITAGAGITVTPSPITGTGSVALTVPVTVANGGTGLSTLTLNNVLVGNGASAVQLVTLSNLIDSQLAGGAGARGQILWRTGTGFWGVLAAGTAGQYLRTGGSAGNATWAAPNLASEVTGTLPVANGGTGATTLTGVLIGNGTGAFTAQAPLSVASGGTGSATKNFVALAGDTMTGPLTTTQVTISGNYLYLANGTGTVNGSGGPFLYADANSAVMHLGSGNNAFYVQSAGGSPLGGIDNAGWLLSLGSRRVAMSDGSWTYIKSGSGADAIYIGGTPAENHYRNTAHYFESVGGGTTYARFDAGGTYNASGSWQTLSDARLKRDVTPYMTGLDAISALRPVRFRWKDGDGDDDEHVGLIAQEVERLIPEVVGSLDSYRTLSPTLLIYACINAIRELRAELLALKAGA